MQRRSALVILTVLSVCTGSLVGVAMASTTNTTTSSDHDFDIVGAIDTPSETVETEEGEYTIDEIGAIEPGEIIEVDVTTPNWYHLTLYNSDEQEEFYNRSDMGTVKIGSENDDVDTSTLDPGTYMLSFEPDNGDRQITPVVIQGYDISFDYPTTAEKGSTIELEATVESTSDLDQPEELDVAIWDGTNVTEVTLDHSEETEYKTSVSLNDFETGTYEIYGSVVGDETVRGYSMVLAVKEGTSLTVTAADTTDGENNESGGGNNETDSEDSSNNEMNESNESSTDDHNLDENESNETNESSPGGTDITNEGNSTETNDSDSNGSDNIIEPNDTVSSKTDNNNTTPNNQNEDGLGTPAIVPILIAITTLLLSIRHNNRS